MSRTVTPRIICLALTLVIATFPICVAQQPKDIAPVPTPIFTAKKVFISNLAESAFYGSDQPYDHFYAAMKSWGHYELVGAPADADLIFELNSVFTSRNGGGSVEGYNFVFTNSLDVNIRLVILDQKTHVALWAFNKLVSDKFSRRHPEELDRSIGSMLESVKKLATPPAPANAPGK